MTTCLHCGAPVRGRADKKYCDDMCRSAYHNEKSGHITSVMRETHKLLRRNWKILHRYHCSGRDLVAYMDAHREGFVAEMVTGVVLNERQIQYRCYEYVFAIHEDGLLQIDLDPEG